MLIFESSRPDRRAYGQSPAMEDVLESIPERFLRKRKARLPEVSEMQVVRHYTRLSQKNFSIDTHFYPLGSCTMKYNPRACNRYAMLPGFLGRHPLSHDKSGQGVLSCLYELQEILKQVTGMSGVALSPMAGAQGEFAGVAMIKAYHDARGDHARNEIIVPDAAHGTNPASAVMCGYKVKEIPTAENGDVDVDALKEVVGPQTAGIMLTNPSTLGVFERRIEEIATIVHDAGGLLYYDGANLNAILGKVRPGDMGFDVIHINLHKTFSTPHGGGGPGAGPVGVSERLRPYLPIPIVAKSAEGEYSLLLEDDIPQTIGRMSAFMGNVGVLLRAYIYARMLGHEGMVRVGEHATLSANYLMARLKAEGFTMAPEDRRATHEFIVTLRKEAKELGLTATDMAKRLLDYGFHAPTIYFPLLIPECLLIEPTESEDRATIDRFVEAMVQIVEEAKENIDQLKRAPMSLPVSRLDEVRAAKELDIAWRGSSS